MTKLIYFVLLALLLIETTVLSNPTNVTHVRSQRKKRIEITNNNFDSGSGTIINNNNGMSSSSIINNNGMSSISSSGSTTFINNNGSPIANDKDLIQLLNNLPIGSEVFIQNGAITIKKPQQTTVMIISPKRNKKSI